MLLFGKKSSVPKVDPCGVFDERVDCNSVLCANCQRRVHLCFSDVPRKVGVVSCRDVFICRTCLSYNCLVEEKLDF